MFFKLTDAMVSDLLANASFKKATASITAINCKKMKKIAIFSKSWQILLRVQIFLENEMNPIKCQTKEKNERF